MASVSPVGAAATVSLAGAVICYGAAQSAISGNGRYVAFTSCSPLLDGGPTNPNSDVFVHDFVTGRTTKVSVAANGLLANGGSDSPSISADGRYVAFQSQATNLTQLSCSGNPVQQALCVQAPSALDQVYVRDMVRKTTRLVSMPPGGGAGDGSSYIPTISADGRYVAFTSRADDLVSNDNSLCPMASYPPPASLSCGNVYRADLRTGKIELVSVALNGQAPTSGHATAESGGYRIAISADGRYVGFASQAAGLVPNDGGPLGVGRIYVRDMVAGRTVRAWVDSAGENVDEGGGTNVALDASGRYVYFDGTVPAGCATTGVLMLHDSLTGASVPADRLNYQGKENPCPATFATYASADPSATADGREVAFISAGTNLVRGDTNGKMDVFVRDLGRALGVGQFGGVTVAGAPAFTSTGVLSAADTRNDVTAALTAGGGELIGATVAYRPEFRDLFVRLSVKQMPLFAAASPVLVYGMDFAAKGVRYELRAAKTGPLTATFGVFRRGAVNPLPVQVVRGGYGTSGQEVDFAVPLSAIGLAQGGRLSQLRAFTALGTYPTGPISELDSIALTN